jgi:hypothetical protein
LVEKRFGEQVRLRMLVLVRLLDRIRWEILDIIGRLANGPNLGMILLLLMLLLLILSLLLLLMLFLLSLLLLVMLLLLLL